MTSRSTGMNRDDMMFLRRVHVNVPMDWAQAVGTDFWIYAAPSTGPLASSQGEILSEHGWTTTSLAMDAGSGADLMTSTDVGTPGDWQNNAQNDRLQSPALFGSYDHAFAASRILGQKQLPRYLCWEAFATFSAITGTTATTALGMVAAAGSILTSANSAGTFFSDGTNFRFNNAATAATSSTTVVADTNPHWFRVVYDQFASKMYPYIDLTKLVSSGVTITQDIYPMSFGAGSGDATNLVLLNQAHIWYDYKFPTFWTGR